MAFKGFVFRDSQGGAKIGWLGYSLGINCSPCRKGSLLEIDAYDLVKEVAKGEPIELMHAKDFLT